MNNNQNNPRILFNTIDRLINLSPTFPNEFLSITKCNEFAAHFRNKVLTIRKNINQTRAFDIVDSTKHFNYTLHSFTQVDADGLSKVIAELNPTTCILDLTWMNKTVLSCLLDDVLDIVNHSLFTGTFPQVLKTAMVKPLLKKSNLDPAHFNNYRPISNLPFLGKILEKVVLKQILEIRALWQLANFTCSLLLIVLCNMAGYLSDFDDVDDNFEYNGRPYRSEWAVLQRQASMILYQ